MDKFEEKKEIKVVSGDGKDLDISPVYNHVNVNRTQQKPKKNIVIPKSKSEKDSTKKEN